ncbi:MAG: hypothetical protein Q4A01_08120 [Coriobacteriales bacterium]|nr:hypothetical protein [Coriobacteriales bacterium]
MFKHSGRVIVSAGLAGILAIGTCACSSSVETKTEVSTETTNEDGTTTKNTESTKTTTENGTTTTESQSSSSTVVDINSWTDAWKGETENGKTVFYAESPSGVSQALIAIYDPQTKALVSHSIGEATIDDGTITIIDAGGTGSGFVFGIESQNDDGTAVLDLGEEYGKATLKRVDMQTFLADIKEADTTGEFLA